ncbi:MAG: sulfite exporter TauE/SafE family protein [bacterium]
MLHLDTATIVILLLSSFVSGFVSTVAGLGGGILVMPALVWAFGVNTGVVILSTSMLWGNIVRYLMFREHTDYAVIRKIWLGALIGAAVGASLLNVAPEVVLKRCIAGYLVAYVVYEIWGSRLSWSTGLNDFPVVGAVTGLLSGMFGVAGPISAPFLVNYGLTKERFIATNMLLSLMINAVKAVVYSGGGLLSTNEWIWSGWAAVFVSLGIWLGAVWLNRIDEAAFKTALLAMLLLVAIDFVFPVEQLFDGHVS